MTDSDKQLLENWKKFIISYKDWTNHFSYGDQKNCIVFIEELLAAKDAQIEQAMDYAYKIGLNQSYNPLSSLAEAYKHQFIEEYKKLKAKYLTSVKDGNG